jgi:hypothetical protein
MKYCEWCGGNIIIGKDGEEQCLMCSRSTDMEYELRVKTAKEREHGNWHIYDSVGWKRDERGQ